MGEQYTDDILQNIKDNPVDWVAVGWHSSNQFNGIRNNKTNVKVHGFYACGMKITIGGVEMPLCSKSRRLLRKVVKSWQVSVPALYLQGDIALVIEPDQSAGKMKLVG